MLRKINILALTLLVLITPLFLVGGASAQEDLVDDNIYYQQEEPTLYDDTVVDDSPVDDYYDTTYDSYFDDEYTYSNSDTVELTDEQAAAFFAAYFGFIGCILLISYVYNALVLYVIAQKLGEEKPWMAWVPVVNMFYMFKVAGLSQLLALLLFVPLANLVVSIYAWMKIAERRRFPNWMGLLILVPLVGFFVPAYIAWGEASESTPQTPSTPQ